MSSGSYNSVNKDDDEECGHGQGGYRQFSTSYNDSQAASQQQQQQQQDGMSPQPSVGRFAEKEKTTTMFSRKPPIPKHYDGGRPWHPRATTAYITRKTLLHRNPIPVAL